MNRRTFSRLATGVAIGTLTLGAEKSASPETGRSAPEHSPAEEVVLEDGELLVAFDAASGALTRLQRRSSGWVIQRRPEFGASFRIFAPLPNRRDNFVFGQKQRVASLERMSDHQLRIVWKNLVSEHGGTLPIVFTATVTLQKGSLTFESAITNDSQVIVEAIDYPCFGDFHPPVPGQTMSSEHMWYGNLVSDEIYPHFRNEKGYWGVTVPTKTVESKQSPFCLIQSRDQGLYIDLHEENPRYLLQYTFEQHPGVTQSVDDSVQPQDTISGLPVRLEFRTCHFVFAHPQSMVNLAPVVLRAYSGDWHSGVDIYKQWRAQWFKPAHLPEWIGDVHSWLQLQVNGAEEDYSIPYREIPKYAAECAKNGVGAIQLVGWNIGGQDRGDPSQDTDPGLGTHEELRDAIAQSQAMGVKIVLFGKLNWADLTTERYKSELYKYAATDPYGVPYQQGGYSYTTPTQLAGINNRRRAVMDFLSPQYRDIATREFEKILKFDAAGWLFDEVCHHGPVEYSFSPDHGYRAPGYIYAGDIPMSRQLRAAADKVNPNFLFAGEGPEDWLMQYYPASYFRINSGSVPVSRYVDPQAPLIVAVTGFDDREMLNLILLNRYIISYEPYNFKGHVTDFPLTLAYGQKIDALRRKYRNYLWNSEFRDTLDVSVAADGGVRHSVFVNNEGKRAVIVVNNAGEKAVSVTVHMLSAGKLVVATPEQPEIVPATEALEIPARSAVVLMEQ